MEVVDKIRHVRASKLLLILHLILLHRRINLFLQDFDLLILKILHCLIQNCYKQTLALLHQEA